MQVMIQVLLYHLTSLYIIPLITCYISLPYQIHKQIIYLIIHFTCSQEYSHAPLPSAPAMSQSLQSLSMRDWIDASQSHRHTDFYSLYGQSSTKHYVTS